jgi:phage terminase large subunit-like protein
VKLAEGMLSAEVVDTVDGWLWHSDKIDSMSEVVLDWFGRLVVV